MENINHLIPQRHKNSVPQLWLPQLFNVIWNLILFSQNNGKIWLTSLEGNPSLRLFSTEWSFLSRVKDLRVQRTAGGSIVMESQGNRAVSKQKERIPTPGHTVHWAAASSDVLGSGRLLPARRGWGGSGPALRRGGSARPCGEAGGGTPRPGTSWSIFSCVIDSNELGFLSPRANDRPKSAAGSGHGSSAAARSARPGRTASLPFNLLLSAQLIEISFILDML